MPAAQLAALGSILVPVHSAWCIYVALHADADPNVMLYADCRALAICPQASGFNTLVLAGNELDDTSMIEILAALKYNDKLQLQFLDLSNNAMFGAGAKVVAELLQDNRWGARDSCRGLLAAVLFDLEAEQHSTGS
jgi:hypothetical protein